MIDLKIRGVEPKAPEKKPVKLWLEYGVSDSGEPCIQLMADGYYVMGFLNGGTVERYQGLPESLGFQLDKHLRIHILDVCELEDK